MSWEVVKYGDISKAIQEGNQRALLEIVMKVTAYAKALAPVDTGQLRGSIMGRVVEKELGHKDGPAISPRPKIGEGYVGSGVLHSIYNEFGTRRLQAQPFLRPAIAAIANGANVRKVVSDLQQDAIKKGMARGPRKKKVI